MYVQVFWIMVNVAFAKGFLVRLKWFMENKLCNVMYMFGYLWVYSTYQITFLLFLWWVSFGYVSSISLSKKYPGHLSHTVLNSFSINFNSGSCLTIYRLPGWCKEAIKLKKTKILRGNFEKNTIFNSGAIVFYLQVLEAIFILQVKMIQTSWIEIQTSSSITNLSP